jgi:hypothetical protein
MLSLHRLHCFRPVRSMRTGISFFPGMVCRVGGSILKFGERSRNGSGEVNVAALPLQFERYLLELAGLSGELDFQVGIDGGRVLLRLRQFRANHDHGIFRAALPLRSQSVRRMRLSSCL